MFTTAIKYLLALLQFWHDESHTSGNDSDDPIGPPLRLCRGDYYVPKDYRCRGWEKYQEDYQEWEFGRRHVLFQHRYEPEESISKIWMQAKGEVMQSVTKQ